MFKKMIIGFLSLMLTIPAHADLVYKSKEEFANAEASFKAVMQLLLEKYVDKNLTKEELYKAATSGMLESLNSNDQSWNKLLSPEELSDMKQDLTGKVSGIGAELKFDENTGHAQVIRIISGSPAEKAGMKIDDQILSVDSKKFKGKTMYDLVMNIRGSIGSSVSLRILRDDKILNLNVKRQTIAWTRVDLQPISAGSAVLTIGYFTEETPKLVEEAIKHANQEKIQKLIVDLRGNMGGGFEQAIQTAELFIPKGELIVSTKDRSGKVQEFKSKRGLLDPNTQLVLIINKETKSGAELFAAALKENRKAKLVGENTFGKWNAQSVESLPNSFGVKFTVKEFLSPSGKSYQSNGIKPDIEIGLPKEVDYKALHSKYKIQDRIEQDSQFKAAVEISKAMSL